jgi:DNA polymerase-4
MPMFEALKRCPDAVVLRGDMRKYQRESARIRTIFASVSPAVEPLSLDEAFIDVTASIGLLGPPLAIGRRLKDAVRAATGLTVSVGIGPGKMIAKIAGDVAKPDGLTEVRPERVEAFLAPLPVGRLWGVGPVTQAALREAGIVSVGDLRTVPRATLARAVGRAADALVRLARGEDVRVVEPDRDARSYGEEGTFDHDVRDVAVVRRAIIGHAEAVARRLRKDGVRARIVVVKWKLTDRLGGGRFPLVTRRRTLGAATDDGKTLADAALALWEMHRPSRAIRLVGVAAAGIGGGEPQLALFADPVAARRAALNQALDTLVARWGTETVVRGGGRRPEKGLTTRLKPGE